ncbi:hypothetical protein M0R45_009877 [Rubus argutus]|uniref:Uncharacterized protein n=1 Tax=Rubus argutus TaxID=59490 RepID=A0AAW1Y5Q8_RUBAR
MVSQRRLMRSRAVDIMSDGRQGLGTAEGVRRGRGGDGGWMGFVSWVMGEEVVARLSCRFVSFDWWYG